MKRNLLYICVSGIITVYSLPTQAQQELKVVCEDNDEHSISITDKVSFLRQGQSERYAWKPSSSSSSSYSSQGSAFDISKVMTIRRYMEPVVFDVTNPETSEIKVVSLEKDGTMAIEAPEGKAPRVGDILCSGPTEEAPYGYMLKVTEITKTSEKARATNSWEKYKMWKFLIKTTAAVLNEVLSNFHYPYHVNFDDIKIDQVTDNEGHVLEVIEENPKEWKVPMELNLGPNLTIKPEITIKPKDLALYIDVKDKQFEKFGADFDFDIDVSLRIDAKLNSKFEKTVSLFHILLDPIPICETPPIAVTPLIQVYLTFKADGQIKLSCVPIRNTYEVNAGAYYDFKTQKVVPTIEIPDATDKDNKYQYYLIKEKEIEANKEREVSPVEAGLYFNGSASASIGASLSIGVDGCNYVGRVDFLPKQLDVVADMLSLDLWYDFNRVITANLGIDNIKTDAWDEYNFWDGCKVENYGQAHLQFFLRVWNPFKDKFVGYEPEKEFFTWHFWEDDLFPTLFVPDYKKLSAKLNSDKVMLNVSKYKPYFWNTLFKEESYGFQYGKYVNRDIPVTDWKNVVAINKTGKDDEPLIIFDGVIPISDLEKGCTYIVCPYSYGIIPTGEYNYLRREGLYFRVNDNGTLSFNELPDIPGFDL